MMVVRGTVPDGGQTTLTDGQTYIFPADRCSWQQTDSTGDGYAISNAIFWPGAGGGDGDVPLSSASLGFIGKSGRFVEIAS